MFESLTLDIYTRARVCKVTTTTYSIQEKALGIWQANKVFVTFFAYSSGFDCILCKCTSSSQKKVPIFLKRKFNTIC